jgi:two-component system alkaline phosphatase synthesis response regulator PhoP
MLQRHDEIRRKSKWPLKKGGKMMMKKKILVVEDEAELTGAIQIRLEQAGYEVLIAYDGQQALEKARGESPDLIVLDLMLPKIDGYKVCRMLKFDEKYKKIPVVMLTARAQEKDESLGYEVGADAFITKPFKYQVLLSKIRELLGDSAFKTL